MLTKTRTSDVTLYRRCRRAWYFQVIAGVPQRPRAPLDRGTLGHADVERWLTTGQAPSKPAGKVLVQNLQDRGFEPGCAAGGQVLAEWSWALDVAPDGPDFGVVRYTGQADLVVLLEGQDPILLDHKTTANLAGALTPDELRQNVQLGVYANAILTLLAPAADQVGVIHNYAETRGKNPIGRLVGATISRAEAAATWADVVQTVAQMRTDAAAGSAEQVPGDPTGAACAAFGGCPFQSRCTTWARLQRPAPASASSGGVMSMLSKVRPAAATESPAPAATPASSAPTMTVTERVDRVGPGEPLARPLALYIDCVPVPCGQGEVLDLVHLEQYLGPLVDEVCRRANVPHYGFIDGWVGKAQVAALLEANLPEGHVVVDSRLPLSPMCIEVLVKHATSLTRGSR